MRTFFKVVVFVFMAVVMSLPLTAAMAAPLHDAIKAGDLEKVKDLVSKGADVNAKNADGLRPLQGAAFWGNERLPRI